MHAALEHTFVLIKVSLLLLSRGLLIIRIHWEHHCVLVGITMTKLLRQDRDTGTAHVCLCGRGRCATVCFFSHPTMILLGRSRPSPWKRLRKQQQIFNHHMICPATFEVPYSCLICIQCTYLASLVTLLFPCLCTVAPLAY